MNSELRCPKFAGADTRFRFDINALRALAVIAVLGYHLQVPGFAGGFVGVDVFFVITGYLMTSKVVNDLIAGRYCFSEFVMMRLRRIFPALVAVVVATAIAEWFLTLPGEYFRHLRQACYTLLFLSNFAFDADNGYFSMAAQTKPLLHTWSLAVEWQFYIWLPLALSLVWRRSPRSNFARSTIAVLSIFAIASLCWCLWQNHHDAMRSSFFSLRARAWEPLVGGIIAAVEMSRREKSAPRLWLSRPSAAVAGWVLIATCIAYPLPESDWPGALTIFPIVGAVLVVAANQGQSRLIRTATVQRLGDWSYSIYLWHWPIWVLASGWLVLRGYDVAPTSKALMAVASIALAAFSYRYVEQPIRARRDLWTPRRLVVGSGTVFASLLVFTIGATLTTGYPNRLPSYLLPAEMARKTDTPRDECFRNSNSVKKAAETYCSFGRAPNQSNQTLALWGDSFANQYLEPLSSAASAVGIQGLIATQSACRPFIDDPSLNSGDTRQCRSFNRETLKFVLADLEPSIVVLAGNWGSSAEISSLVETLLSNGKTVVLVMPLLNISFDVPQKWIENQIRAGAPINDWKIPVDPVLTNAVLREGLAKTLSDHVGDPHLVTVDPQQQVCDVEFCYLVRDGQANFRDTAHISNVNADRYESMFEIALRSVVRTLAEAEH